MAAHSLFSQGWLSALYARYAEDVMVELRLARGLDEHAPGFDPDADVTDPKRDPLPTAPDQWRQSLTTSLWSPVALVNRAQLIQEAAVWLPVGLPNPATPDLMLHATGDAGSRSDSYTIQALRLDLTAPCPFDQLTIFRPVSSQPPHTASSEEAEQIG